MNRVVEKLGWGALAALWAIASGTPAIADDTEVFRYTAPPSARANVLFIIDDSISMRGEVESQSVYDPGTTYPMLTGCSADRVYWSFDADEPPECDSDRWFNLTALQCKRALDLFATVGKSVEDRMAQYNPTYNDNKGAWRDISSSQKSRTVECADDDGIHGDGGAETHAVNGQNPTKWSTSSPINWGYREEYTLYSVNYVNWYYGPAADPTRLEIVQGVVDDLLESLTGVNVGLMDFNSPGFNGGSQGGSVTVPIADIETNRDTMRAAVKALEPETYTPLAETLYEARQYFAGGDIVFGSSSDDGAKKTVDPSEYQSPVAEACQQNFVVFLTDGEPTYDNAADEDIVKMQDAEGSTFEELTGSATCDLETWAGIDFADPPGGFMSHCLDDVAHFLYEGDITDGLEGTQRVKTITVGFNVDLPVLEAAAERGNGRAPGDSQGVYYTANNATQLASVFQEIIGSINDTGTSFTSPTVAVNAFNRAENLSDLFVSVFKPSQTHHWPGNLKKYRLRDDGVIVDADNNPAVDPDTGFFVEGTRSYWTVGTDGADVELGGAAHLIPSSRRVYTNIAGNDLNATGNVVNATNMTETLLESAGSGFTVADIVKFINGVDPETNERRYAMGDPLHSQPVSVIYGPGLRDGTLFVATNDGYLHALDVSTGVEQWAFLPNEFLPDQVDLLKDETLPDKHYGIDGPLRIHVEGDNDGVIESGEKVYLFMGMRRGGDFYYALDVTNPGDLTDQDPPADPQVLWRLDGSTLTGLGETWSPPVVTRVKIDSTERLVLVIGGGYEPDQDLDASTTDTTGNSIYIVDAVSGALLWRASKSGATENYAKMDYSFPAEVRVLDLDGDKLMDRMYAADMGGQVWRFDVTNGNSAADLVAGGVIAQLGAAGDATPTVAENRRFYYAPDVAFVNTRLANYVHIGIGSGHREHPLGTVNSDRFYAIRDKNVANMEQSDFDSLTIITDGSLRPITAPNTTMQPTDNGWRFDLEPGEKVLAEARTIANQIFFTTFRPGSVSGSCQPQPGFTRLYRMSVYNGSPVANLDGGLSTEPLSMDDLFVESAGTISSTSQVIFVSSDRDGDGIPDDQDTDDDNDGTLDGSDNDSDNDGIPDDEDPDDDNDGIPDVDEEQGDQGWVCTDRICVPLGVTNSPVRTYWRQTSLD